MPKVPVDESPILVDLYHRAMTVQDATVARMLFRELIEHTILDGVARQDAEVQVKANLGYRAGWYSLKTRQRVERLFNCVHPILGPASVINPDKQGGFNTPWGYYIHLMAEAFRKDQEFPLLHQQPKDPVQKSVWERLSEDD